VTKLVWVHRQLDEQTHAGEKSARK